jgi:putative spermidine/putrescine transport system ATP-binding protein
MSDRVAVMNAGRIEQLDSPAGVYARPATPFVLDFVGLSTRLHGTVAAAEAGVLVCKTALGTVRARGELKAGDSVIVAVRPEQIRIGPPVSSDDNALELRVRDPVFLGSKLIVHFDTPEGDRAVAELAAAGPEAQAAGAAVTVSWPAAATLVYPA